MILKYIIHNCHITVYAITKNDGIELQFESYFCQIEILQLHIGKTGFSSCWSSRGRKVARLRLKDVYHLSQLEIVSWQLCNCPTEIVLRLQRFRIQLETKLILYSHDEDRGMELRRNFQGNTWNGNSIPRAEIQKKRTFSPSKSFKMILRDTCKNI